MHERFQCSVVTNVCMHVQVLTFTYMLTQMPREAKSGAELLRVTQGLGLNLGPLERAVHTQLVRYLFICL